ncbi:hypothetical protein [Microaceticoccus formicicus]|uniref:hypothetical protein n=1 Tax=Microaceticoccus formicicus TaxID=3118105 RepID=UPI003CD0069E|nr:hypothetical protein VZL98_07925 [Peptoniphilaceae bacterium AMB_02]
MNNLKYKIMEFMRGRNGLDLLGRRLQIFFIASMVITILLRILDVPGSQIASLIGLVILILLYMRIFSKDIPKMRRQQAAYFEMERKFIAPFLKLKRSLFGTKDYVYMSCPNCKEELRVPRGKGKLKVTCPSCKHSFIKRT